MLIQNLPNKQNPHPNITLSRVSHKELETYKMSYHLFFMANFLETKSYMRQLQESYTVSAPHQNGLVNL